MNDPRSGQTRAQEEAAEWLAKLGAMPISTRTVRDFRDWRDDPANDAAYQEAEAFWEASGEQAADPEIMKMTDAALSRRPRRGLRPWLRGPRLAWTLTLAGLAGAGGTLLIVQQITPAYATRDIEQKVVRLDDGSRVHLNVDSRVQIDFRGAQRRVTLTRGEAFFDVAHDPTRPFVVQAGDTRVQALGTKFDVRRDGGDVQVTLLQGSVQVAADTGQPAVILAPNQQLVVARGGTIQRAAADAARTTSWTTGRLMFRRTPLAAAVAEVNRYAERKIELTDPGLGARPVSGFFDVGDSEAFAKGVAVLFDLKMSAAPKGPIRLGPDAETSAAAAG